MSKSIKFSEALGLIPRQFQLQKDQSIEKSIDQFDLSEKESPLDMDSNDQDDDYAQIDLISPFLTVPEPIPFRAALFWQWVLCISIVDFDLDLGPRNYLNDSFIFIVCYRPRPFLSAHKVFR